MRNPGRIVEYYFQLIHCFCLKKLVSDFIKPKIPSISLYRNEVFQAAASLRFILEHVQHNLVHGREHSFDRLLKESMEHASFNELKEDAALRKSIREHIQSGIMGKVDFYGEEERLHEILALQLNVVNALSVNLDADLLKELVRSVEQEKDFLKRLGLSLKG